MVIGDLKISRWVLAPELLLCFVPLAMGWMDVVWGVSGITKLTPEIVERFFLNTPRGTFTLVYMILEAVLGLLSPIVLALGAAFIIFKRPVLTRGQATGLIAVALAISAILAARLIVDLFALNSDPNLGGFATAVLMFSILPAVGVAHMYYLGGKAAQVAPVR